MGRGSEGKHFSNFKLVHHVSGVLEWEGAQGEKLTNVKLVYHASGVLEWKESPGDKFNKFQACLSRFGRS